MQTITFNTQDLPNLSNKMDELNIKTPLIAVYCGASAGNDEVFTKQAFLLGKALAKAGFGVVYGGASIGMMGAVADGVRSQNGVVVGVIPQFLLDKEIAHNDLISLWITDTMHTRKTIMATYAVGFVAVAGGFGTLEELFEIATWRQLEQHHKPIIVLNTQEFYTPLLTQLDVAVSAGFLKPEFRSFIEVANDENEVVKNLTANLGQWYTQGG